MNISRLKKLSGINENVLTPDEEDAYNDRQQEIRMARERKIYRIVMSAFNKIGLRRNTDNFSEGIIYDDDTREVTVELQDSEIDIDILLKLKQTGLSEKYEIIGTNYALDVKFTIYNELDNAII